MIVGRREDGSVAALKKPHAPIHVLGLPGSGKTTLLGNLAEQALENGEGVVLFDIKDGELAQDFTKRTKYPERVVYISPAEDSGWTLNLLAHTSTEMMVDAVMDMFERQAIFTDEMTIVKDNLLHGLWLAHVDPDSTLHTLADILTHESVRTRLLSMADLPQRVIDHWQDFRARPNLYATRSTLSRLDPYLVGEPIASMVTSVDSTIELAKWLDDGKAVVFNLVSGVSSRQKLRLGNVIMTALVELALSRPIRQDNRYWRIIADEFDLLAAQPFIDSIDKLRSAHILPVMANQNMAQLPDKLANSLSGAPTRIYFTCTGADVAVLGRHLGSEDEARTIAKQPEHQVRLHQGRARIALDTSSPNWVWEVMAAAKSTGAETVLTEDWWSEPVPGQLERVREASLRDRVEVHETTETPRPRQPRPEVHQTDLRPGRHRTGSLNHASSEPLPADDQSASGRASVSGLADHRGEVSLGQDVPTQSQREPEPPHRLGVSDQNPSHPQTPRDPEQVHDAPQPPHPPRGKATGRGTRPRNALGFEPKVKLPPKRTKPPGSDK